jgi:hypothetical protein
MAKTWVLRTDTKGTGAQMVPLEDARKGEAPSEPHYNLPRLREPEKAPEPRAPRRFKVVDVMTRRVLAEDVDARAAVDALKGVRSVVDVNVYVWQAERDRWRPLTFPEERALFDLASAA